MCFISLEDEDWKRENQYCVLVIFIYIRKDIRERDEKWKDIKKFRFWGFIGFDKNECFQILNVNLWYLNRF